LDRSCRNLPDNSIDSSGFFDALDLSSVVLIAKPPGDLGIDFSAWHAAGFPNWVEDAVNMLPRVLKFLGRYVAERLCPVGSLVMATNVVAAGVAFPEWQIMQVKSMRINL
jgi:hypothetical protein